jgi:DNA-directed RNA polymerase subunit RPC12/RpoP
MKCVNCGGELKYDVATYGLKCDHCGYTRKLHTPDEETFVSENDYKSAAKDEAAGWGVVRSLVTCKSCGASMTNDYNQMSGTCPFCGSVIVLTSAEANIGVAPSAIIPFKTTKEEVTEKFYKWNKFAFWSPEAFRKGKVLGNLMPVYIPYWTFDSDTITTYSGKFGYTVGSGDDAYTKWYKSSGVVEHFLNDYTVCASRRFTNDKMLNSIASKFTEKDLIPYTPEAVAGIPAEVYTIGIKEAWDSSKEALRPRIIQWTCKKENADAYSNLKYSTEFTNIKYKYVLVPVYLAGCKFNGKVYNVVASGYDGRGNCKRPLSVPKLIILIACVLLLLSFPILSYIFMLILSLFMNH